MEKLKKILENVTREGKPGINYHQVFDEVLNLLHAELCRLAEVREDEVAILFLDSLKNLRFFRPQYLAKSGIIPASFTRSYVTKVLQTGRAAIENHFHTTQHLVLFEEFRKNNPNVLPIQKMMCIPLKAKGGNVFGALEISKKGNTGEEAGADWTEQDMGKVVRAVADIEEPLHHLCVLAKTIGES